MKHEDFNERYNEIMFDERDVIEKFLKDQYDLRYGHQRDTWHFEPSVKLTNTYGMDVFVTDIKLDNNKFVTFTGICCGEMHDDYECFNFAYGELSKIIDALPDADEINKRNAETDLRALLKLHEPIGISIENAPYKFTDRFGNKYEVLSVAKDGDKILYEVHETLADGRDAGMGLWENLNGKYIIGLRDHININVLHRSYEYNRLVKFLAEQPNLRFEPANWGDVEFTIHGTGVKVDVLSASLDSVGALQLCCNDVNENIYFGEKAIRPEYLVDLINYLDTHCYNDIMDTYNGHNPELVRKINAAWKSTVYHDKFGEILLAILVRDHEEYIEKYGEISDCSCDWAMAHAHEIMEGVCDDWDLETILGFIRYK